MNDQGSENEAQRNQEQNTSGDAAQVGSAESAGEGGGASLFSGIGGDSQSAEVARLTAEAAELKDKYLRAMADFENFKRRTQKERSELIRYQGEPIIVELLEVVDGFERALEHAANESGTLKEGLQMIHKQFVDILSRFEIRGESSVDKEFDPNRHRAIGKQKIEGKAAGLVIGELKKAYMYRDKLIRFGEVIVAAGDE